MPMLCQSVAMLITSQFQKTSGSYTSILLDILEYYKPYINKYKTVVTGKESRFTYDHTGKGNFTFFLDYAFTNTEVKDYKLYSWEESNRMSDHLPICVEV